MGSIVDLRSDTVTLPTEEMIAAAFKAPLGDAKRGEDPAVRRLEERAAALTGMEAAIFVPTGTMGNLAAIMTWVGPGDGVVVESTAHVYTSEYGGMWTAARARPIPVPARFGLLDPGDVDVALRGRGGIGGDVVGRGAGGEPKVGLLVLETSHNAGGGTVIPLEDMIRLRRMTDEAGVPIHLDGARLFNAAIHLRCSPATICRQVDSVVFCLSKGLGAPVGSVLSGSAPFIRRAREKVLLLGGGMRQAGWLAAAGLVALENPGEQLEHDHRMASFIARELAAIHPSIVKIETVQTNIVNVYLDELPELVPRFKEGLRRRGVLVRQQGQIVRLVTHRHIGRREAVRTVEAIGAVLTSLADGARRVP